MALSPSLLQGKRSFFLFFVFISFSLSLHIFKKSYRRLLPLLRHLFQASLFHCQHSHLKSFRSLLHCLRHFYRARESLEVSVQKHVQEEICHKELCLQRQWNIALSAVRVCTREPKCRQNNTQRLTTMIFTPRHVRSAIERHQAGIAKSRRNRGEGFQIHEYTNLQHRCPIHYQISEDECGFSHQKIRARCILVESDPWAKIERL